MVETFSLFDSFQTLLYDDGGGDDDMIITAVITVYSFRRLTYK
jgi:hypothetical protein